MSAAALVSPVMAAAVAFAVMAAGRLLTVVMAAAVSVFVMVVVVVTAGVGIKGKPAFRKRFRRCVRRALYASVELDAGLGERHLCAHTDAAADERVDLSRLQEAGKRAVSAAVRINDLFRCDRSVLHVVQLELLGMPEVLEYFSVLKSDCDPHSV